VTRAAALWVIACLVPLGSSAAAPAAEPAYRHFVVGNPADVVAKTSGLLVLQGGGDDVDDNYVAMGAHAGGGDFVVLRASGDDEYNEYIYKPSATSTSTASAPAAASTSAVGRVAAASPTR